MKLSVLRAARESPSRTALVADGEAMAFGELAARVRRAIAWLGNRGVGKQEGGKPAGLLGDGSLESLILLYALMEMRVPAAMAHPRSPERERRRWLAEIGADVFLDPSELTFEPEGVADEPAYDPEPGVDDDHPLAIVRTSGSSGRPKGVVLSRRAFAAAAAASAGNLGWREDDRWLLSLPIAHVGGLSILTRCLAARRAVVLRPLPRFDAGDVARILEADRVTLLSLVPTQLGRLLDHEAFELPSRVRAVLLGGAASPPMLLRRAADRGWPVLSTYGLTEACSQVATQRYGTVNRGGRGCEPVAGMEVRIRDGVVEIRGVNLMNGYLPAAKASPFDSEGWFATGDLGRIDGAGRLHVLGRRDDVIVSGGENVHPREVEEALLEHPAIRSACVFGVPDAEWGQTVVAALVAVSPPDDDDLVHYVADRLAGFQWPRRIAYLAALPRTAAGKLDRRQAAKSAIPELRRLSFRS